MKMKMKTPSIGDLPQEEYVVLDPSMTEEGEALFKQITGEDFSFEETPRHHPALLWLARHAPQVWTKHAVFGRPLRRVVAIEGGVYALHLDETCREQVRLPSDIAWVTV